MDLQIAHSKLVSNHPALESDSNQTMSLKNPEAFLGLNNVLHRKFDFGSN